MTQANVHEAKTHLSRLIEQVMQGEEVVIARAGVPVVRLVKIEFPVVARRGGQWAGLVRIEDHFDDELPREIAQAFAGESH